MISPTVIRHAATKDPWHDKFAFLRDIKYHVREVIYRFKSTFIRRRHIVHMRALNRSWWYDSDKRIFEANFQILVEYVEKELVWMEASTKKKSGWRHAWYRKRHAREMGIAYLDWEISLDDPIAQSEAASKVKELYLWYKDIRPLRTDPWEVVPDRPFNFELEEDGMYTLIREDDEYYVALDKAAQIEQDQYNEDTEKVIEVVRIRQMMWT